MNPNKDINICKEYQTIIPDYITAEQAVAIANSDLYLKNSIFKQGLKKHLSYGLILFDEFSVKLVKWGSYFAWHIKVNKGEWGATQFINILGFKFGIINWDGEFSEEDNISCLIMVHNGEYIYLKKDDMKYIEDADMDEYLEYISQGSIWVNNPSYKYENPNREKTVKNNNSLTTKMLELHNHMDEK